MCLHVSVLFIDRDLARVRLRAAQVPSAIYVRLDGPLVKKGHKGTAAAEGFRKRILEDVSRFGWECPPRAKVTVEFSFFGITPRAPRLHHLVKYYLDLLKGIAFKDDRQVHLLEAHAWQGESEPHVHIKIERLASVHNRLRLAEEFSHQDGLEYEDGDDLPFGCFVSAFADKATRAQALLLEASRIHDHESTLRLRSGVKPMADELRAVDPLTFRMGSLPVQGNSDAYRTMLNAAISDFRMRWEMFETFTTSIELDVRVTSDGLRVAKDLDNVMLDVYPILARYLGNSGQITGYRAYVAEQLGDDSPGDLWLKVLPSGSIRAFNEKVQRIIDKSADRLN